MADGPGAPVLGAGMAGRAHAPRCASSGEGVHTMNVLAAVTLPAANDGQSVSIDHHEKVCA